MFYKSLSPQEFPIIFHGILGKDEREESNPSFFNISEIEKVVDYLKKLLCQKKKAKKGGGAKISPKEVGVITPYHKQVNKKAQVLFTLGFNVFVNKVSSLFSLFTDKPKNVSILTTLAIH